LVPGEYRTTVVLAAALVWMALMSKLNGQMAALREKQLQQEQPKAA
jgi:hypothetical protein